MGDPIPRNRPKFQRASFEILLDQSSESISTIRSLPDLIQHNAVHNPDHIFCIQCKQSVKGAGPGLDFIRITFLELQRAVNRCCQWLLDNVSDIHVAEVVSDGTVSKCPPIALFMESDVGLFVYIAALLTLNVPVRSNIRNATE